MKKLQVLVCFISSLFVITSFAMTTSVKNSGPFYLPGGLVKPGQHFTTSLSNLPKGADAAYYNIVCYIQNSNFKKQYPVILKTWVTRGDVMDQSPSVTINGHKLNGPQAILDQLKNIYEAKDVYVTQNQNGTIIYPALLHFINLDNSDSVLIESCLATYAV